MNKFNHDQDEVPVVQQLEEMQQVCSLASLQSLLTNSSLLWEIILVLADDPKNIREQKAKIRGKL